MLENLYKKLGVKPVDEKAMFLLKTEVYEFDHQFSEQQIRMIGREPIYAGKSIGFVRDKMPLPSLDELQRIGREAQRKIWVSEKAEWLFICGRDVFEKEIMKQSGQITQGDFVAVLNRHDECIGIGIRDKGVKRFFDVGDFLRRERKRQKLPVKAGGF